MKPAKGKAKVKITSSGKKVSYGQAGKAKGGGRGSNLEPRRGIHIVLVVQDK